MQTAPDYLNPGIQPGLNRVKIPIVEATEESLTGLSLIHI